MLPPERLCGCHWTGVICGTTSRQLHVLELDSGRELELTDHLSTEYANPRAQADSLLRSSALTGVCPPEFALRDRAGDHGPAHWLRVGWRARLGDVGARQLLLRAAQNQHFGGLKGLAVCGPEALRDFLPKGRQLNKDFAAWMWVWPVLGSSGEPLLLELLDRLSLHPWPLQPECLVNAWLSADRFGPEFWTPLLRLARRGVVGATILLTLVDLPDLGARLVELLSDPGLERQPIAYYFQVNPCPQANGPLLQLLKFYPHEPLGMAAVRALQAQNRVDFGTDLKAWEDWLQRGFSRPPAEKGRLLLSLQEPTGLLWQAQVGQLDSKELEALPRVRAVWPVGDARLSSDGSKLFADGKDWYDAATGAHLQLGKWDAYSPDGRLAFAVQQGRWRMQDLRSGRRAWLKRGFRGCSAPENGAALLLGDVNVVVDLEKWRFYPLPASSGWSLRLHSHLPRVTYLTQEGPRRLVVFDWQQGRVVQETSLPDTESGGELTSSRDGDRLMLVGGAKWQVFDQQSRLLADGLGQPAYLSPDGQSVVSILGYRLECRSLNLSIPRSRSWSGSGQLCFRPDSSVFLAPSCEGRLSLVGRADLVEKARFWGPSESFNWDRQGLAFSASDRRHTAIYQFRSRVPRVSPEDQVLLCELWTGVHLVGGQAQPLTDAQYLQRVRRWNELGGGSWYQGPADLPDSGSPIYHWFLGLGILGLVSVFWKRTCSR